MFDVIEMLKKGKRVFIGCCMNAFINEKPMIFENKKEAIKFYANYTFFYSNFTQKIGCGSSGTATYKKL